MNLYKMEFINIYYSRSINLLFFCILFPALDTRILLFWSRIFMLKELPREFPGGPGINSAPRFNTSSGNLRSHILWDVTKKKNPQRFLSDCFSSVPQSCPTPCDPMNCSTPGLPVHHQLPEFTHSHPSSRWCHQTVLGIQAVNKTV